MKLRLTESDLKNLISSTVKRIIKEGIENAEILGKIVERLSNIDIQANVGSNDIEVPLDNEGNTIAFINFEIEDGRYLIPGEQSFDIDVPSDPDEIGGDFEVYVNEIIIYDEDNQETPIEDNGMVANALKDLVELDETGLEYDINDDQSGWNDAWR